MFKEFCKLSHEDIKDNYKKFCKRATSHIIKNPCLTISETKLRIKIGSDKMIKDTQLLGETGMRIKKDSGEIINDIQYLGEEIQHLSQTEKKSKINYIHNSEKPCQKKWAKKSDPKKIAARSEKKLLKEKRQSEKEELRKELLITKLTEKKIKLKLSLKNLKEKFDVLEDEENYDGIINQINHERFKLSNVEHRLNYIVKEKLKSENKALEEKWQNLKRLKLECEQKIWFEAHLSQLQKDLADSEALNEPILTQEALQEKRNQIWLAQTEIKDLKNKIEHYSNNAGFVADEKLGNIELRTNFDSFYTKFLEHFSNVCAALIEFGQNNITIDPITDEMNIAGGIFPYSD